MRAIAAFTVGLIALAGCDTKKEEGTEEAKKPEGCVMTREDLIGKSFVFQKPDDTSPGKFVDDNYARLQLFKDGDKTKAKYSVRSLSGVYTYSCADDDKGGYLCKQDEVDLLEFCRALWANTGDCTPAQLAAVTDIPETEARIGEAVTKTKEGLGKLKPDQLEKTKLAYNNPNVQLRGWLKIRPPKNPTKADGCYVNVHDYYETFSQGAKREVDNLVGQGKFKVTEKDFAWEDCRDINTNLVALSTERAAKPGETETELASGSRATFRYVGADATASDCTYTFDAYANFERVQRAVPIEGGKNPQFEQVLSNKGRTVYHMVRYKACGGANPALATVSCAAVDVK